MEAAIAFIVGYLSGSLSGARIVAKRRAPDADLSTTKVVLDGTGAAVLNHGVSPSSLQARAGAAGGLRAGAIDILKALIPTLVVFLIWGDGPELILVSTGAFVGHIFPIYHRFQGGFGISPLLGSLVVIDIWSIVVPILVFGALGVLLGSAYLGIDVWPIGLIPWFIFTDDPGALAFAVLANALYWWRSRHEAVGAFRAWRADTRPWKERVSDFKKYPDYEVPAP